MRKIIDIQNVSFSYPSQAEGKKALNEINLSIEEGEFLLVSGENGAGKSTFCKLINGIVPNLTGGEFSGNVIVDGENTLNTPVPRLALKTGMVLDDPDSQIFTSSVFAEAAFGPENLLLSREEIKKRVNFALEATDLLGFETRKPKTLSGGEKQRLAIACALAMAEKILVLDDPLSRLDPEGAKDIMAVIKDIRKNFGITVIMAVNDNCRLEGLIPDRVCILKEGRITACDNGKNRFINTDIFSVFTKDYQNDENKTQAINIINLSYSFSHNFPVFKNFNLTIYEQDFAAVIGSNGCGKTTLLKLITGLLRPYEGDIQVFGKSIKDLPVSAVSKEIGYVMQNPDTQLFTDSLYNEVSFVLKNEGLCENEIKSRTEDALLKMGLCDFSAYPPALPRADRTKALIACILAMKCKIIFLDEADARQDYSGCKKIMDIARELNLQGYTIVFVTHNHSLACEYANRLIMIDKSIIEKNGSIIDRRK